MLKEADTGFLFHSPNPIQKQFPQFQPFEEYNDLLSAMKNSMFS
jgi:phosphoserine/homoserine phosphotransferase